MQWSLSHSFVLSLYHIHWHTLTHTRAFITHLACALIYKHFNLFLLNRVVLLLFFLRFPIFHYTHICFSKYLYLFSHTPTIYYFLCSSNVPFALFGWCTDTIFPIWLLAEVFALLSLLFFVLPPIIPHQPCYFLLLLLLPLSVCVYIGNTLMTWTACAKVTQFCVPSLLLLHDRRDAVSVLVCIPTVCVFYLVVKLV